MRSKSNSSLSEHTVTDFRVWYMYVRVAKEEDRECKGRKTYKYEGCKQNAPCVVVPV
jgi:hypothetical protein